MRRSDPDAKICYVVERRMPRTRAAWVTEYPSRRTLVLKSRREGVGCSIRGMMVEWGLNENGPSIVKAGSLSRRDVQCGLLVGAPREPCSRVSWLL